MRPILVHDGIGAAAGGPAGRADGLPTRPTRKPYGEGNRSRRRRRREQDALRRRIPPRRRNRPMARKAAAS